ncbi:MAG: metal-dependent hydrolase, partial [Deltaproteobacteria bacterium]|nr:metal-dependent hydrolase [Deltaproteobacteria bacterium]
MDPLTHLATGVICSQLLPAPSRWWAAAAGAIFALLPDVDYFCIFWDRLAFIRYHRGFTHSLVALLLFALAGALLGRVLGGPRWFKPLFILGLAVLASHLLLDLATSYGTQVLSPFSRQRFSLDWIFIIDPYFTALLLMGAIAALSLPHWGPRVGAWFLATAAVYLLVCASYHHQALDLARRIFPDVKPGVQTVAALPQPFSSRRWQLIA